MRLTEQQVGRRMRSLPERFADRVPDKQLQNAVRYRDAGEWAECLGALIAALHQSRATITSREDRSLRDFLETFRPGLAGSDIGIRMLEQMSRWLDDLEVVPSLTEQQMIDKLEAIQQQFADRVPAAEIEPVRPDEIEPGIWFEVAYDLMRTLARHRTPVSMEERAQLSMILDALDLPRLQLSRLPATDAMMLHYRAVYLQDQTEDPIGLIVEESSDGPLRAVIWDHRRQEWTSSPDVAARIMFDERNRRRWRLVSRREAQSVARSLGATLPSESDLHAMMWIE